MPQIINTNIMSLNSQRNLNSSQNSLSMSIQRLSSGLRINSAKDDAAGLAISERMTGQIRGLNQAARNANDGISLSQTAEGALGEIGSSLQRIRELAVQSVNDTNTNSDRSALNAEVTQLKAEIDRVADQTTFNGQKLVDGSFTNRVFQVGANVNETITVSSLVDANTANLGTFTQAEVTGAAATTFTALAAGDVTIQDAGAVAINVGAVATSTNSTDRAADLRDAINAVSDQTGVYATNNSNTELTLTSEHDIVVAFAGQGSTANTGLSAGTTNAASQTGFATLDISTRAGANTAITAMDAALSAVNTARADLGAIQNRFESSISQLNTQSENLSAARSRIRDTDFAAETAALSRNQILQQAGLAMVSQANSLPQQVLSLLR